LTQEAVGIAEVFLLRSGGHSTQREKTMTETPHQERSLVTTAAKVVGAVFLLVGILGFIPGITSNYSSLSFAGHMSEAKLLGIFQVSILHNIVHILFGIAGIAMAKRADSARTYLIGGGIIYLVLWIYGLVTSDQSSANFVPVNTADDWLHLVLGLGMIALGVVLSRRRVDSTTTTH
jgi:arginine exporter protein ArgO